MKRSTILIAFLLIMASLFAESKAAEASQTIAGFINHSGSDYMKLTVTYDVTSKEGNYYGINLDVSEAGNSSRYLIAPSATHELGLRIGTLNLEATNRNYNLHIYHEPLILVGSNPSVTIDYELSISYSLTGGDTSTAYCLSATTNPPDNLIDVSLRSSGGVILIQNAGLYFRLRDASQVRSAGQYQSTISIQVGTE